MPELAEVDFYRRQWNPALGQKIRRVHLHPEKRIFRGNDLSLFARLAGRTLLSSEAAGKQMLFRFSGNLWLGLHLGMTGKLALAPGNYIPGKHDHLVLFQKERALVFTDPRQFGRALIHLGRDLPSWWAAIPPAVTSAAFTPEHMAGFLRRHSRLPIKAALLHQQGFPGIGNWMADEILWRAKLAPSRRAGLLTPPERHALWREVRWVSRQALRKVTFDSEGLPPGWLFHQRWNAQGTCPKHGTLLRRETIGGRTTAWCPKCQH